MEIRYCNDCDQPYYWPGQCNCKENRLYADYDEWFDTEPPNNAVAAD